MLLDAVLRGRSDSLSLRDEIAQMGSPRKVVAAGVQQTRRRSLPFALIVDEPAARWRVVFGGGVDYRYEEGTLHASGQRRQVGFYDAMPLCLLMLWPARLPIWSDSRGQAHPTVVTRSDDDRLHLTFEHTADLHATQTVTVDARGLCTQLVGQDHTVQITSMVDSVPTDWALPPIPMPVAPVEFGAAHEPFASRTGLGGWI